MASLSTKVPIGTTAHVPPVVPGSFLLGSAVDLRRDMLAACEQAFRRYGDVVRFRAGPPGRRLELYLLFHPDAAHRMLAGSATNYRKDNVFYSEIRSAFGDGLLTSQDAEWQRQKRFLQPLFTAKRVDGYAAVMTEQMQEFISQWRSGLSGTVDLHDEMTQLTLRIVCRILFGADLGQALPVVQRAFGPLGQATRWARTSHLSSRRCRSSSESPTPAAAPGQRPRRSNDGRSLTPPPRLASPSLVRPL